MTAEPLQAILDNPEDTACRRVYADALSTAGDPRGEFIQIQCDLDACTATDPRRGALVRSERALLAKHAKQWIAPFAKLVFNPTFRRGMIEEAFVNPKTFVPAAGELLGREPVVSLAMRGLTLNGAATLGQRPELARLHTLRVTESALAMRGTAALISARLANLRELDLYQAGVDDHGLQHLHATVFPQLERLVLSGNRLSPSAVDSVLHDSHLARIKVLALAWLAPNRNGAHQIARQLDLPALTHLDLASHAYSNTDLATLATNRTFARLRGLTLTENQLSGGAAIEALAPLTALEELDLSTNLIGVAGATALAASRLPLRRLDLMQSQLGDDGVCALANGQFPELDDLDLRYCGVGPRGAAALARVEWPLTKLDLWANPLGDDGARALAGARFTRTLRTLVLGYCNLTDAGVAALAGGTWPALERIVFRGDAIGEVGARALAASTTMPALSSLKFEATGTPKSPLAPLRKRGVELEF